MLIYRILFFILSSFLDDSASSGRTHANGCVIDRQLFGRPSFLPTLLPPEPANADVGCNDQVFRDTVAALKEKVVTLAAEGQPFEGVQDLPGRYLLPTAVRCNPPTHMPKRRDSKNFPERSTKIPYPRKMHKNDEILSFEFFSPAKSFELLNS